MKVLLNSFHFNSNMTEKRRVGTNTWCPSCRGVRIEVHFDLNASNEGLEARGEGWNAVAQLRGTGSVNIN